MGRTLRDILDSAARGQFPAADGGTTIVPQHGERDAGVIAFTAHAVVFTGEDPAWVRAQLAAADSDPLAAAMHPRFLTALLDRTGRRTDTIDLLTVASPLPGPPPLPLVEIDDPAHPRVARALEHRDEVRVWAADGDGRDRDRDRDNGSSVGTGTGVLVLGRGVAGRWEAAVEVDPAARGRGLGVALATAARHLAPAPVWAQQAPGNARAVRTFQAAGFRPVGAESLHVR
ncbi:GNAT family N-acetyltransferase [Streptomyces sp. NRRL F-5123]|uniref:GNAT family N-acetyltransferase n=1 Tax=Streptomyces sp. NRRL F-5123 TaxID=1463856 RepID=UPI0004E18FCB|nr:GNAT family N-acetyltransferase [Streptomyces sp. NRRL F-5123]